jgi:hypothetical protein
MNFLTNNWKEVLLALIAIFAGIAITFKIINSNKVNQKNNTVGNDMAGRDINKK